MRGRILYEGFSGIKFPFIFLLGGPKYSLMVGKSADGSNVLTTSCSMWRVIMFLATLIGIALLSVFELFRLIGVTVAMMWLLASGRRSVMRHRFASCDVGGVFPLPHDFFLDEFYLDRVLIFPR